MFGAQKTGEGQVDTQVSPAVRGETDVLKLRNRVSGHCMFVVGCLIFLSSTPP